MSSTWGRTPSFGAQTPMIGNMTPSYGSMTPMHGGGGGGGSTPMYGSLTPMHGDGMYYLCILSFICCKIMLLASKFSDQ